MARSDPLPAGGARPLPRPAHVVDWAFAALGGALGSLAILVTYWVERSRLPAQMAVHFGTTGAANGWSDPWSFTLGGVGLDLANAAVFSAILYGIGRSSLLEHRYGHALRRPVLGAALLVSLASIPISWIAVFLLAAGEWPSAAPGVVTVSESVNILVIIGLLALVAFPTGTPAPATIRATGASPAPGDVGFECPSCGEVSAPPSYWMFMPRLGVSARWGGSSYYFRCARCHEWGWQRRAR